MIYTVHVGPRQEAWPPQVAAESTRAAAQATARRLLGLADASVTKAEVRCQVVLLDTYSRRQSGTIRHVHEIRQRQGQS